jgi:hypothetical protein
VSYGRGPREHDVTPVATYARNKFRAVIRDVMEWQRTRSSLSDTLMVVSGSDIQARS